MKLKVQDVPKHSVVCFQGEWGVLAGARHPFVVLDRWHGGKIRLEPDDEVEMLLSEGRPKSHSLRLPR